MMAVTPVNNLNKQVASKTNSFCNTKSIQETDVPEKLESCNFVASELDPATTTLKKKRGRPKKNDLKNENKSPIVSNIANKCLVKCNENDCNEKLTDLKPENLNPLTIVKRGRGRPKKIMSDQIESIKPTPKKRGRKKRTNIIEPTKELTEPILENNVNSDVSSNSKLINIDINADSNRLISKKIDSNDTIVKNLISSPLLKCVTLERCDDNILFTQTSNIKKTNITRSLKDIEPDLLLELNEINWNVPIRKRSKSSDKSLKMKSRRNSLSDDFVFNTFNELETKNEMKLGKTWKSLSYLEGGPNVQMERHQYNELSKKFRLELKRSRSFPNCMLLDTVIWRFLVYQQTYDSDDQIYDSDECTVESDEEINLTHELSINSCHQYRSKSVPPFFKQYTYKKEKNGFSKSQDDLNMYYDDYSSITSIKTFTDISNLNNTAKNDSEESKSKIRRSKRLNTKIKDADILEEKYLLESDKDKFNYLLHAEQIRLENERQLSEARKNDPELEKKLKKLNFMLITNNMFRPHKKAMSMYTPAEAKELRRLKPKITINGDAFNCHCKYTKKDWIEANPGCGLECLNRLLNIECGPSCLLKSFCTNKQFQNKQFKRTEIVKTPNKGYGVFALEDIPSGSFVDEYIGEVIDQHEMIKRMRKKMYMNNNYMVQLKHDEIIDATRKGNITRFINHSCEPNCVAEKWNVLGESRMGFFSKDIIRKGEEITFDYSFEIFGDAKQQKCYCNAQKCRGVISKKSRTLYEENDNDENNITTIIKPGESKEKKEKNITKKITLKNSKRLQELDQQLTDISKLKNKNRSDLESATLNLNKLMVHITDSMSRSHILKFIRENDLNCKRLFMNFNGLCIMHSWMTSNNNETLKLEIIKTLSDLPISNRNTITKSKVLDIVADWAKIPLRIKEIIENLEYPESKSEDHWLEVDKLLPDKNNISELVHASRLLWKKWIILKMVFKIPKLERPKEIIPQVSKDVAKPSITTPQKKTKNVQYHFGKPIISNQDTKIHCENNTKLNYVKCTKSQDSDTNVNTNSIDTFNKIINYQNHIISRDKNKAVHKWNKNLYERTSCNKSNNVGTFMPIKTLVPYEKRKSTYLLNSQNNNHHQEIPTIESGIVSNKRIKLCHSTECTPKIFDMPKDMPVKFVSKNIMNQSKIYPIETIISTKFWSLPVPTVSEINEAAVLESMLKMRPPCLPKEYKTNLIDKTDSNLISFDSLWTTMNPENVLYDNQHPSTEEQLNLMSTPDTVQNKNLFLIDISDTNNIKKINKDTMIVPVSNESNEQRLFKQCEYRLKKLLDEGFDEVINSTKKNCMNQSLTQLFKLVIKNKALPASQQTSPLVHFFNTLKLKSNFFRKQPSDLVKLNFINSTTQTNNEDVFRISENNEKTKKYDSVTTALTLCNKSLNTTTKNLNIQHLFSKQCIEFNTSNKFACKIFNNLRNKLETTKPNQFVLKLPSDTKVYTLDQVMGLELQHKLTPTVNNTLCATLKNNGKNINVFEQRLNMKYDESKSTVVGKKTLPIQKKPVFSKNIEERRALKRKLPLPPTVNIKKQKMIDLTTNHNGKLKTHTLTNETNKTVIFKKPILPPINKKYSSANTIIDNHQPQKTNSSDYIAKSNSLSKTVFNHFTQEPSTSSQFTSNSVLTSPSPNEIRQKPLMKCLPFNKLNNISAIELEQNVKNLAISLSNSYSSNVSSLPSMSNNELIEPIVDNFNSSMVRTNLSDDPIVRDYIQRTQMKTESKRKHKLPDSILSLPPEILRLIPDNQRQIKCVVDFYHGIASLTVKILDSYCKKNCIQGRIRNDEDFKFLAKKLHYNILIKELQVKSIDELRVSDSIRQKVLTYITKYMLKYGRVYKRKSTDTPSNE